MSTMMKVMFPEVAMPAAATGKTRRLLFWIVGASAVFCVAIAIAVFMFLGHESKLARHGAQHFGAALVANDASLAPAGSAAYVSGVRAHFGAVSAAKVIATHNKAINTGDSADTRSFYVADLLLSTRRGPAVIQVEFDNHSLSSEAISGMHEIEPSAAPGLSGVQRTELQHAFAARGGTAADDVALSTAPAPVSAAATHHVAPAVVKAVHVQIPAQLSCVQRAHHDVTKLARCAG